MGFNSHRGFESLFLRQTNKKTTPKRVVFLFVGCGRVSGDGSGSTDGQDSRSARCSRSEGEGRGWPECIPLSFDSFAELAYFLAAGFLLAAFLVAAFLVAAFFAAIAFACQIALSSSSRDGRPR